MCDMTVVLESDLKEAYKNIADRMDRLNEQLAGLKRAVEGGDAGKQERLDYFSTQLQGLKAQYDVLTELQVVIYKRKQDRPDMVVSTLSTDEPGVRL